MKSNFYLALSILLLSISMVTPCLKDTIYCGSTINDWYPGSVRYPNNYLYKCNSDGKTWTLLERCKTVCQHGIGDTCVECEASRNYCGHELNALGNTSAIPNILYKCNW